LKKRFSDLPNITKPNPAALLPGGYYERLILDAMRGDHTLFTTAEGIEGLWEKATPLLDAPSPVRLYSPGSWGPM
jgi:glucose-6-phosphate 1-dehydrogenase